MKDKTGIMINMGEDTTIVSVFNKGILLNTEVLELGSSNIDNDLSFVYKITRKDAKLIKNSLCLAHPRLANPANIIECTNDLGEMIKVNQYEASSIAN